MGKIGEEWNVNMSETALFARSVNPGQVSELRVGRDSHHGRIEVFEFVSTVAKCDYLGWADEREVEWIEQEDEIFSNEVGQFQLLELAFNYCRTMKIRRWFKYLNPDYKII